jgi:D-glycero-D-manno-heptose 1,7-bisphosphate phosphatase
MRKAVFLDRDGVINKSLVIEGIPNPPSGINEIEILEGVVEAVQLIKKMDYIPVVFTNQPDVARGKTTQHKVNEINSHISKKTSLVFFYTCFHDDLDDCKCRKPKPGLILRAAKELDLDINQSFLVGDRWRDIQAGQLVGCKTFFIDYSYNEKQPDLPFTRVSSLLEATMLILNGS